MNALVLGFQVSHHSKQKLEEKRKKNKGWTRLQETIQMEGEMKNIAHVWLSVVTSLCYCYFISSKIQKGMLRLISLLPIFYLFTILPLYSSSPFLRSVIAFFITWLANFKLLLFSFDQGPLPLNNSLSIFITSAALPIRMKQNMKNHSFSQHPKTQKKLPLNLGTEILLSAILIGSVARYKENMHPKIVLVLYCCMVFLLVDVLVALSSFVVRATVGLELDPPSDEPYLSTSLQEFWGRRWNLTVTNTLRYTIYRPVRSIFEVLLGKNWALPPAVLATFIVSGLMHELLFWYVTRAKPSWEMTMFFVLQGVCVVMEITLKIALNGKLELPWFVSGPLTLGFVVVTSFWLFFPPLIRTGADAMVLQEFTAYAQFVKSRLMTLILSQNSTSS